MNANEQKKPHEVRIYIDQQPYHSLTPTTGEALYKLGKFEAGMRLYREVVGNREEQGIENGPEVVHLKQDEHFHSGKPRGVTIIVEGTRHPWDKPEISYVEVVVLFDPTYPQHPETTYSVKYRKGPSQNPEGILSSGSKPVKVKEGMIFNVSRTGES